MIATLINEWGSFRRVIEAYWLRYLGATEERDIEDAVPKDVLIGFKPISTTGAPNPLEPCSTDSKENCSSR